MKSLTNHITVKSLTGLVIMIIVCTGLLSGTVYADDVYVTDTTKSDFDRGWDTGYISRLIDSGAVTLFIYGDTWYNIDWLKRHKITIQSSQVDTDCYNFPIMLTGDNLQSDVFDNAQANGEDLVFTDTAGEKLSHEIELFDTVNDSAVIWVKVTFIDSDVNTDIYVYYKNATAGNQEDTAGVWTGYEGVWHLGQDPGTSDTDGFLDSTLNANHGQDFNDMSSDDHVMGKCGYAVNFDGADDYIKTKDESILQGDAGITTFSFWMKGTAGWPIDKENSYIDGNANGWFFIEDGTNQMSVSVHHSNGFHKSTSTTAVFDDSWHYIVGQFGSSGQYLYVDGVYEAGDPAKTKLSGMGGSRTALVFGCLYRRTLGQWQYDYTGTLDEVRGRTTAITSAAQVSTEYNNMSNPASFAVAGDVQP